MRTRLQNEDKIAREARRYRERIILHEEGKTPEEIEQLVKEKYPPVKEPLKRARPGKRQNVELEDE
jgi:hypothetical protein